MESVILLEEFLLSFVLVPLLFEFLLSDVVIIIKTAQLNIFEVRVIFVGNFTDYIVLILILTGCYLLL